MGRGGGGQGSLGLVRPYMTGFDGIEKLHPTYINLLYLLKRGQRSLDEDEIFQQGPMAQNSPRLYGTNCHKILFLYISCMRFSPITKQVDLYFFISNRNANRHI